MTDLKSVPFFTGISSPTPESKKRAFPQAPFRTGFQFVSDLPGFPKYILASGDRFSAVRLRDRPQGSGMTRGKKKVNPQPSNINQHKRQHTYGEHAEPGSKPAPPLNTDLFQKWNVKNTLNCHPFLRCWIGIRIRQRLGRQRPQSFH